MGNQIQSEKFSEVQEKLIDNFLNLIQYGPQNESVDFNELNFFEKDPDYLKVIQIMNSHKSTDSEELSYSNIDKKLSRAIACFVCSGIGDALGTHTEFMNLEYNREKLIIEGFKDKKPEFKRCNLGEFSDDTSMALCLADSLLIKNKIFDGADLQIKFVNWWESSYNNCLKPRRHSFGLGGNISNSLENFLTKARQIKDLKNNMDILPKECDYAEKNANGNGSLMRLAPVPIAFASNPELLEYAKTYAYKQSKVTHTGNEAAEACRLLTHLIIKNISRNEEETNFQEFIEQALEDFVSEDYSVSCLKNSIMESETEFNERINDGRYMKKFSKNVEDRNWNWKDKNFRYSPTRAKTMPNYIGSYCLDALSMALHISYYSDCPQHAILKAANMGGDCDTVAAIVGQIVGSFYGLDEHILTLYEGVSPFDNFKLAYMAYKLYTS